MEALIAHCKTAFMGGGFWPLALFMGGLAGSLTHCLVMCGPNVACQAACSGSRCRTNYTQWHYHLGRFATYGAMGFVAALLAHQIQAYRFWPSLAACMLVLAGVTFLLSSAATPNSGLHRRFGALGNFGRGVMMSFMPCGLIYAALMVVATFDNPVKAMVGMWFFVLGTLPALMLSSGAMALVAARWQMQVRRVGRAMMACNGLALIALAIGLST